MAIDVVTRDESDYKEWVSRQEALTIIDEKDNRCLILLRESGEIEYRKEKGRRISYFKPSLEAFLPRKQQIIDDVADRAYYK